MNDGAVPRPIDAYSFNDVEVKVTVRELRIGGERVHVEPLIFDVLLYLVENRSRVVTADELLIAVWHTAHVSETVLPRAIMKLRKALGDGDRDGCIRTVNKVGYRFSAAVQERLLGSSAPPTSDLRSISLALLPFDNQTGDPSLVWVELGMTALVINNVSAQAQLRVASVTDTLIALHTVSSDAPLGERMQALKTTLGVSNALHASVRRAAEGYRIDWRIVGSNAHANGSVCAEVITDAALKLCPLIVDNLLHKSQQPDESHFCLGDDFLNTAYARAMQALEEERAAEAVRLLDLCMTVERRPLEVDFELLRALCSSANARAVPFGELLLDRTVTMGDPSMEAKVSYSLAVYFQHADSLDKSREYGDRAIALSSRVGDDTTLAFARLSRARVALWQGDFSFGAANGRMALEIAQRLGDLRVEAMANNILGAAASREGQEDIAQTP